jgi:long-chain fatty acid transport protein
MVPIVAIPFGFYVRPVSSRFTIGFGIYAPFGGETDYEHNFIGRYQGSLTKATVITFQPTASYRLNNHWSIGGGLTVNRLNGQIGSAASNAVLGGQGDSELLTKGEATSVGYNIGLLYNAEGNFSFGSTYHSKVGFRLTGATTINGANGLLGPIPALGLPGINGRYPASLSIITPESLDNSITYHVAPGWILSVGALWTRWDRFQNLNVSNQDIPTLYSQLNTLSEPLGWRNTWSYSVGASHQLSDALTIKAGLAYDPTPVPNKFMSVRVPTGDRKALSLGLQWQTNAKTKLDLAYGYINENAVEVDQATTLGGLRPGFQGKYKNHFNGISMQLSHAF